MYEEEEKNRKDVDMVNHPPHYTSGYMEVIDMMIKVFGSEYVMMYCYINAFKYRMRAGSKKDTIEDIKKAQWYENKAKDLLEGLEEDDVLLFEDTCSSTLKFATVEDLDKNPLFKYLINLTGR